MDEVVQVLTRLDDSLSLDHTQKWVDIHQHVSQNTMPAIDRVIGNRSPTATSVPVGNLENIAV